MSALPFVLTLCLPSFNDMEHPLFLRIGSSYMNKSSFSSSRYLLTYDDVLSPRFAQFPRKTGFLSFFPSILLFILDFDDVPLSLFLSL